MLKRTTVLSAILFLLICSISKAAQITLSWDPNNESDLAGYKIYYGKNSGSYSRSIDVGNTTSYTITGLDSNTVYYAAATAYNTQRLESGFSNEIIFNTTDRNFWRNYQYSFNIQTSNTNPIGTVFYYTDEANFYRFRWDATGRYIEKCMGGAFSILVSDDVAIDSQTKNIRIRLNNNYLKVFVDEVCVLYVRDTSFTEGGFGFYSSGNNDVNISNLLIRDLNSGFEVIDENFQNPIASWKIVDAAGSSFGPSQWTSGDGYLRQTSEIYASDNRGSHAIFIPWDNYYFSAKIRSSDNDIIGVVFRYREYPDNNNISYYRYTQDSQRSKRMLAKCTYAGCISLAEDNFSYEVGRTYILKVVAGATNLKIYIDGSLIFNVVESSLSTGTVGLYSWGNQGSYFDNVSVKNFYGDTLFIDLFDELKSNWSVKDQGDISAPSDWRVEGGEAVQMSNINSNSSGVNQKGTLFLINKLYRVR